MQLCDDALLWCSFGLASVGACDGGGGGMCQWNRSLYSYMNAVY